MWYLNQMPDVYINNYVWLLIEYTKIRAFIYHTMSAHIKLYIMFSMAMILHYQLSTVTIHIWSVHKVNVNVNENKVRGPPNLCRGPMNPQCIFERQVTWHYTSYKYQANIWSPQKLQIWSTSSNLTKQWSLRTKTLVISQGTLDGCNSYPISMFHIFVIFSQITQQSGSCLTPSTLCVWH